MMQLAARDFGFEADNIPLMIEAIPVSMDTIVLIITKVEDPDELDTRFAKFTPEDSEPDDDFSLSSLRDKIEGADDVLGLIRKITEAEKTGRRKSRRKKDFRNCCFRFGAGRSTERCGDRRGTSESHTFLPVPLSG